MKNLIFFILGFICTSSLSSQNVERYMEYHNKGRMLILEGKYEQSIHYLDTAISIMPHYPAVFQDRGYAKMQLKKYEDALLDFDHVLNKKPYTIEARMQRGMALYHLHHLDEAESDLLEVLNSSPSKSREVSIYLENIYREKNIMAKNQEGQTIQLLQHQVEKERIQRARHREQVIWNTVVPLAFWTTIFLTW